jgi:hypothetical protein
LLTQSGYHVLAKQSSEARECPSCGGGSLCGFPSSWTQLLEKTQSLQSEIESVISENQRLKRENQILKGENDILKSNLENKALDDQYPWEVL